MQTLSVGDTLLPLDSNSFTMFGIFLLVASSKRVSPSLVIVSKSGL
jgi:hypothetical protein